MEDDVAAYLARLSPEERAEAMAAAEAAKRAEERAEQRALERAMLAKQEERRRQQEQEQEQQSTWESSSGKSGGGLFSRLVVGNNTSDRSFNDSSNNGTSSQNRVVFIPKRQREQQSKNNLASATTTMQPLTSDATSSGERELPIDNRLMKKQGPITTANGDHKSTSTNTLEEDDAAARLSEKERIRIMETYLGKTATEQEEDQIQKRKKHKINKKTTFKFRWDETDDTSNFNDDDEDPLYAPLMSTNGGSRNNNNSSGGSRSSGMLSRGGGGGRHSNVGGGQRSSHQLLENRLMGSGSTVSSMETVMKKPLHLMTPRDWRIVRENYEITVKGGQAPPPMRSFDESPLPATIPQLHPAILDAIQTVLCFKEPSPIQRQAIPIGLQRRDLIGISETGSGKTVAFGVPMCHYILNLSTSVLQSVADQGPLALVMAPTRELALQIDVQIQKLLSCQQLVVSCAIVGGQPIQQQAQQIRKGVHIIVGTPGRINECIEMAYLVLNQCCYIVMDEADRMIDMGFAPQMESILDAMGGTMKSEDERETYRQEMEDLQKAGVARHRLTAMFSATMPLEVERIAKRYLRHPSIISIGDVDSSKNSRIVQKLVWLSSPAKKEEALRNLLHDPRFLRDKVIVFVNEKKHADGVGRMVERSGRRCVVLHGGKSQEQREENLDAFRRGGIVMVATDVAGRGLDIPDVAHVINYDLPTRSIENYTHRIGRTGRAGKDGLATSLITDEDEAIMSSLFAYLKSTGNPIPDRLARHPAVVSAATSGGVMY